MSGPESAAGDAHGPETELKGRPGSAFCEECGAFESKHLMMCSRGKAVGVVKREFTKEELTDDVPPPGPSTKLLHLAAQAGVTSRQLIDAVRDVVGDEGAAAVEPALEPTAFTARQVADAMGTFVSPSEDELRQAKVEAALERSTELLEECRKWLGEAHDLAESPAARETWVRRRRRVSKAWLSKRRALERVRGKR